jgi:hypothetical protein
MVQSEKVVVLFLPGYVLELWTLGEAEMPVFSEKINNRARKEIARE